MILECPILIVELNGFIGESETKMKDDPHWINFRWAIDVEYVHMADVPILAALVKKYKRFWDGEYWYQQQSTYILRWPDWRNRYRVDLESFRRHHKIRDPQQLTLSLNGVPKK